MNRWYAPVETFYVFNQRRCCLHADFEIFPNLIFKTQTVVEPRLYMELAIRSPIIDE